MKLYGYWRSTSSYRVRIALALKGLELQHVPVHLVRGEQNLPAFRAMNPQGRVPVLEVSDGTALNQSSAIIEYLEEIYPEPALLPSDPLERARARSFAALIGSDIHPLHNVGPLNYLRGTFNRNEQEVSDWIRHWIAIGFDAIEHRVGSGDSFVFGAQPGLADIYLIPQIYAARRFGLGLEAYPKLARVEAAAQKHQAFQKAHPLSQADAE